MLGSLLKDVFTSKPAASGLPEASNGSGTLPSCRRGGAILWFSCASQGDALTINTRDLLAPFKAHASAIRQIDMTRENWLAEMNDALREPIWFVAAPFGVGQDIPISIENESVNLWEHAGIPFVRFFGDIPAYFPDRHLRHYRNVINGYFDRSHADFYRRWFRDPALSVVLPSSLLECVPLEEIDFSRKLNGKILFPKNGNSPKELQRYWLSALPSTVSQLLLAAAEELSAPARLDQEPEIDDAICALYTQRGVDIASEPGLLCFLVAQIDDYLRRVKSTLIAESLLDLPVIIRGASWEHVSFAGKRAVYDPDFDVAHTRPLIDAAPAIVDMSPNTTQSPHDRVLRAVGRGTAILTNRNEMFATHLPAQRCTFSFDRHSITELVEHYATHPQQAIDLGIEQAKVLRQVLNPERYIECLIAAVDAASLRLGSRPQGTQNFVNFPPRQIR